MPSLNSSQKIKEMPASEDVELPQAGINRLKTAEWRPHSPRNSSPMILMVKNRYFFIRLAFRPQVVFVQPKDDSGCGGPPTH